MSFLVRLASFILFLLVVGTLVLAVARDLMRKRSAPSPTAPILAPNQAYQFKERK